MFEFLFKPIRYNYSSRKGAKVTHIVVHYTGNCNKGADALAHFRYFNGGNRNASAHYFVDDKRIVQIVGDSFSAWAVGDNQGYGRALNGVQNRTSISIEMCVNADGNFDVVYKNTIELIKNLMKKFNIPASNVCRHYDVSRKDCPHVLRDNNWAKWHKMKELIKEPIKLQMDLSKNSTFGAIQSQQKDLDKRIKEVSKKIMAQDKVKVVINGKNKELRGKNINGTNYVAIRDIAEILGLEVGWDQDKQEVILKG